MNSLARVLVGSIVTFAVIWCHAANRAEAQTAPTTTSPRSGPAAGPAGAAKPASGPQTKTPAIDVQSLRTFIGEQQRRIEQFQRTAVERLGDAQQAGPQFDALIEEYQRIADTVGSNSQLVRTIDQFISEYETFARDAAASTIPTRRALAAELQTLADQARHDKEILIRQSNEAMTQIGRLRELKDVAVDLYRLQRGREVINAFQEQIEAISAVNQRMTETANSLEEATRGGKPQQ